MPWFVVYLLDKNECVISLVEGEGRMRTLTSASARTKKSRWESECDAKLRVLFEVLVQHEILKASAKQATGLFELIALH